MLLPVGRSIRQTMFLSLEATDLPSFFASCLASVGCTWVVAPAQAVIARNNAAPASFARIMTFRCSIRGGVRSVSDTRLSRKQEAAHARARPGTGQLPLLHRHVPGLARSCVNLPRPGNLRRRILDHLL